MIDTYFVHDSPFIPRPQKNPAREVGFVMTMSGHVSFPDETTETVSWIVLLLHTHIPGGGGCRWAF